MLLYKKLLLMTFGTTLAALVLMVAESVCLCSLGDSTDLYQCNASAVLDTTDILTPGNKRSDQGMC